MKLRTEELAYWWWRRHGAVGDEGAGVDPGAVDLLGRSWLVASFELGQAPLRRSGADGCAGVKGGVVQKQRGGMG